MRDYTADVFGSEIALIRGTVYMDREALPVVLRAIADAEGLPAHARAAEARFE
jgi:histidinol dehydrogenase